jgi:hypothetical protein
MYNHCDIGNLVPRMSSRCDSICKGTCPLAPKKFTAVVRGSKHTIALRTVSTSSLLTCRMLFHAGGAVTWPDGCRSVSMEHVCILRPVHLGFMVGRVARRQGFLRILRLSPVRVVLTVLVHLSTTEIVYSN